MNAEIKRLFISDLPEEINEQDLQKTFTDYGRVVSLEVKERKNLGPKNYSKFFAYINLEADHSSLQKCLDVVPKTKWKGYHVDVQLARENFLDRLKKEREDTLKSTNNAIKPEIIPCTSTLNGFLNGSKLNKKRYYKADESDSELQENSIEDPPKSVVNEIKLDPDIVIKDNRSKVLKNKKLKIDSVGFDPIIVVEPKRPKSKDPKRTEADMKRVQSVIQMKKEYNHQKDLIRTALSKVDFRPKNKIVFDENIADQDEHPTKTINEKDKRSLFSDEEDDGGNLDFNVKEQFQGKKGQKLLQLQSRFKNDKRFAMDSRFLEDVPDEEEKQTVDDDKITFEEEKQKQYEILEQVLGTNVTPRQKQNENHKIKSMLRFDPTQPDHSKYEIRQTVVGTDKKKKKQKEAEVRIEEEMPEVSKEKFYKVDEKLTEALQEKESFSLLNLFGKPAEKNESDFDECDVEKPLQTQKNAFTSDVNPFRYDSSDDEQVEKTVEVNAKKTERTHTHWNETFFFKDDDYRIQEGLDFIKRLDTDNNDEFNKLRTNLKQIMKTKVRNNLRKNKPFRKKLGGNARRKRIKIKKALQR